MSIGLAAAERGAWSIGAAGLVSSGAAWMLMPAQFSHAWLAATAFWIGWPLGSLALLYIHALTGGRWGTSIRPALAAGVSTLPWVLPALVPLALLAHRLYPWLDPRIAAGLQNRFYLNAPFAASRAVLYLVVWLGLAYLAVRALRGADADAALKRVAPAALILLALTVTFAGIDSTLSLEPHFASSVYGWMVCSEALLTALAAAVLIHASSVRDASIADLARLLLALLVLFAYLDFMQLLIVWNSNLPGEAAWYVPRLKGLWAGVAAAVALLHFFLPLVLLVWPQVQRSRRAVAGVAALLIALEILRAWWIVIPAANRGLSWVDAAAMCALIPLAAATALRMLAGQGVRAHG